LFETRCRCYTQIQRTSGLWYSAEYSTFSIREEDRKYKLNVAGYSGETTLTVAGYSGDAGDALLNPSWSSNRKFSTRDFDNDQCFGGFDYNCAAGYEGGWWYACCSASNINHNNITVWSADPSPVYDVLVTRMMLKVY